MKWSSTIFGLNNRRLAVRPVTRFYIENSLCRLRPPLFRHILVFANFNMVELLHGQYLKGEV